MTISRDVAETLVWRWALAELDEILQMSFPDRASGFLPEAPDPKTLRRAGRLPRKSIEAAGAAMMVLKRTNTPAYRVLRSRFIDGNAVEPKTLSIALDRFSLVYVPPARPSGAA